MNFGFGVYVGTAPFTPCKNHAKTLVQFLQAPLMALALHTCAPGTDLAAGYSVRHLAGYWTGHDINVA